MRCTVVEPVIRRWQASHHELQRLELQLPTVSTEFNGYMSAGTGVRINHIAPGQIDVGVDLKNFDMRGMTTQLPPASLQSKEVKFELPSRLDSAKISLFSPCFSG